MLDEGQRSVATLYEASDPQLDELIRVLRAAPGCVGCRLTGAGWGGCCVALVELAGASEAERDAQLGSVLRAAHEHYYMKHFPEKAADASWLAQVAFVTQPGPGAAVYHLQ